MFCIYESKHLNEKELNESETIIVNEWKQYILKFVDDKNDFTFTNKNYIESNFDNKSIVINENTIKLLNITNNKDFEDNLIKTPEIILNNNNINQNSDYYSNSPNINLSPCS